MPLSLDPSYVSPWVSGESFVITSINHDENLIPGTRNITVQVSHPQLIWTGKPSFVYHVPIIWIDLPFPGSDCIRRACLEMVFRR